jgi:multidrug efflux pump subunit AcrA (membrane-fusion protein)
LDNCTFSGDHCHINWAEKAGIIGKEEGKKVTTEKVSSRTIIETVTASGKISPEVEVKLVQILVEKL